MAEANKPVPKATISVYGKVRMKTAPSNPADPIAVGDNDPRLGAPVVTPQGSETLTAAGATQGTATVSSKQNVLVDTVASAGLGVITVSAVVDALQTFIHNGAYMMNVYPAAGEQIYRKGVSLGINIPYPVQPNNVLSLYCFAVGKWIPK